MIRSIDIWLSSSNWTISKKTYIFREGRCALVTSFTLFKHLLAYAWIMCVDVLILYQVFTFSDVYLIEAVNLRTFNQFHL